MRFNQTSHSRIAAGHPECLSFSAVDRPLRWTDRCAQWTTVYFVRCCSRWNGHEWLSRRAKRAAHELRSRALCIAYISQRINSAAQRCTARAAFVCCADGVCGVDLRLRARRSTPAEPSASLSISCTPSEVQSLSHSENVARCSCSEYSVRTVPQQPQPPEVLRGAAVAVVRTDSVGSIRSGCGGHWLLPMESDH